MAAQVDGSRCDMDVHEVVDYPALNVVLDLVHQVSTAHVKDLDIGELPVKSQYWGKYILKTNLAEISVLFCFLILNEEKHNGSVPVFLIIYRHVVFPVTLNALVEVFHGFIYVTIRIIRAPKFDLL